MSRSDQIEQVNIQEEAFYGTKFYFSYSGLSKLLYSPRLFYDWYIRLNRPDKPDSPGMIEGSIIHCMLLDNGSFNKQFIVSPANIPTASNKSVIDKLFYKVKEHKDLIDYQDDILSILKDINLHQKLKTDQQRIDKLIEEETKNYWEYLKLRGSRDIIDQETLTKCTESVNILKKDIKVRELLRLDGCEEGCEVYNELDIKVEGKTNPFGLRGILDNIVIDKIEKIIYINDLKTSSKTVAEFQESVLFWRYNIQAAIYYTVVLAKFKDLIKDGYKVRFTFIVIDKYQQVYPFEVSENTMNTWLGELEHSLLVAKYHWESKNYTLPFLFATTKVTL